MTTSFYQKRQTHTRSISITSGKGGVGKTTMAANLSVVLAKQNQRVLLFDGDLGMSNLDLFFKFKARHSLLDVLNGEKSIQEVTYEIQKNIFLISGGHGLAELQNLNSFQRRSLVDSLEEASLGFSWIVMDTSPGISENVLYLNAAVDEICLVLTPDPASLADSYALLKLLHLHYKKNRFTVVCNQVKASSEGLSLFARFESVVHQFLNVGLHFAGAVAQDSRLQIANHQSNLILNQDPDSTSAQQLAAVAHDLDQRKQESFSDPHTKMFWGQLMGVA